MDVTSSTMYRTFLSNMSALNEELSRVNQQISTGKKLVNLRDDPASSAESVLLQDESAELDQYTANTQSCGYYLQVADSALNSVQNLIASIQAKGLEADSATLSATDRDAIAKEIRSLRDQIFSLANSEVSGRYIFGGTMISAPPFSIAGDAVTYQGDSGVNEIRVGDALSVRQNVAGSAVFSQVFDAIASLLSAIDAGDLAGIGGALEQLSARLEGYNLARGEIGTELGKVESLQSELATQKVNLQARRSNVEDVNAAEAAARLGRIETALNATMTAGQTILQQKNLFDFLV